MMIRFRPVVPSPGRWAASPGMRSSRASAELGKDKLTPLLRLKYHDSIADAVADLGTPEEISKVFVGFQPYLYAKAAA